MKIRPRKLDFSLELVNLLGKIFVILVVYFISGTKTKYIFSFLFLLCRVLNKKKCCDCLPLTGKSFLFVTFTVSQQPENKKKTRASRKIHKNVLNKKTLQSFLSMLAEKWQRVGNGSNNKITISSAGAFCSSLARLFNSFRVEIWFHFYMFRFAIACLWQYAAFAVSQTNQLSSRCKRFNYYFSAMLSCKVFFSLHQHVKLFDACNGGKLNFYCKISENPLSRRSLSRFSIT